MTLEILICTLGDGISNVSNMILPKSQNISYLISWQTEEHTANIQLPISLVRDDIKIITMEGKGLSRNRNNAINHASGDICLIADDDVTYTQAQLSTVIDTFETHPTVQLATFKSVSANEKKYFPSYSFNLLQMPRFYYISSIEIAFRRNAIQGIVKFNEHFGLGAPVLGSGEEEIFILDVLKHNINAMYFPIEVVRHDHLTTAITRAHSPGVLMARGAYIYRRYKAQRYLRILRVAMRLKTENGVNFVHALKYMLKGGFYAKKNGLG